MVVFEIKMVMWKHGHKPNKVRLEFEWNYILSEGKCLESISVIAYGATYARYKILY
jgi:hypothetical protein